MELLKEKKSLWKKGVEVLLKALFRIGVFLVGYSYSGLTMATEDHYAMPLFSILPVKRPLTMILPEQYGQANADFHFYLKQVISPIEPEFDYQVTNNTRYARELMLVNIPAGVTRIYEGSNVCPYYFTLFPQQNCILRFRVDWGSYIPMYDSPRAANDLNLSSQPHCNMQITNH